MKLSTKIKYNMQIININSLVGINSLKVITGTMNILTSRRAVQGDSEKSEAEIHLS